MINSVYLSRNALCGSLCLLPKCQYTTREVHFISYLQNIACLPAAWCILTTSEVLPKTTRVTEGIYGGIKDSEHIAAAPPKAEEKASAHINKHSCGPR